MFESMKFLRRESFSEFGSDYELNIYRINESGELRLFVAKDGQGIGRSFMGDDTSKLTRRARDAISRNELGDE